ncbi:AMP-binding protein, partial [Streptomyces sp. T21Q-yed]
RLQHALAERLVLSRVRARLGLDRLRVAATGAAPLAPEALRFLLGIGLPVCEAWGMTEVTCVATANRPGAVRIGTVGQVLPGVELRVADDGELLLRGPMLMRGYRGAPEQTAEVLDADGWLHTGDIGEVDRDGRVRIVDRKKELIINAAGKNMSPARIENALRVACPLIGWAVAIGDDRPYVTALLTLDSEAAAAFLAGRDEERADPSDLVDHPLIRQEIERGVTAANATLSRVEQIKKYTLLTDQWEPGSDEITPSLKIRRKPVQQRYAAEIAALYVT